MRNELKALIGITGLVGEPFRKTKRETNRAGPLKGGKESEWPPRSPRSHKRGKRQAENFSGIVVRKPRRFRKCNRTHTQGKKCEDNRKDQ